MLIFGSIFKYYPQFTNLTQVFYENFQTSSCRIIVLHNAVLGRMRNR